MKIIKILTVLVLLSLQAGATGYSHNMFVAHKKLQSGKERVMTREQAVKKVAVVKATASTATAQLSLADHISAKFSSVATLNQRILEEGPASLFNDDNEEESSDTIVTKLVGVVKGMVVSLISSVYNVER